MKGGLNTYENWAPGAPYSYKYGTRMGSHKNGPPFLYDTDMAGSAEPDNFFNVYR